METLSLGTDSLVPTISVRFASSARAIAERSFSELREAFKELIFDIRKSNFQDVQSRFAFVKQQIETLLNADIAIDFKSLAREFNRLAVPVCSADNNQFDVMAKLTGEGKIVLLFLEA